MSRTEVNKNKFTAILTLSGINKSMKNHLLNKNMFFIQRMCFVHFPLVFRINHAPEKRPPLSYDRFYVAVT